MCTRRFCRLVLAASLAATSISYAQAPPGGVNNDDEFTGFKARVNGYAQLRTDVQRSLGLFEAPQESASELGNAAHRLAVGIREARHDSDRGVFFTAGVEAAFRSVLRPLIAGPDGPDILKTIGEDLPESFELKVNGEYPGAQPLTTVPITVLHVLPQLPMDVQYRFIPRHIILFDARANLVLDFFKFY